MPRIAEESLAELRELDVREGFGEDVRDIFVRGDVVQPNAFGLDVFPHPVRSDAEVLGPRMVSWVDAEVDRRLVVDLDRNSGGVVQA